MKRNDIAIIIAVAFVAAIISFVISGAIFGSPKKNPIKVPVVNKISSTFPNPQTDSNYSQIYNSQANDPTQIIKIGNSSNSTPFQGH